MSEPTVLYSVNGHVATISLNRPKAMNASSRQLRAELKTSMDAAEADANIRVVILTGEGRGFSAGADLTESFVEDHPTVTDHILKDHKPLIDAIGSSEKTYLAALHGATAGVSIAYALNCDLIMMAEGGFIYSPFAAISLVPDGGVSWFLVKALGYRRAYEVGVEGQRLTSAECLAAGLVNRVVSDADLREEAAKWAEHLSNDVAPLSLKHAKQAMRAALSGSLSDVQLKEAELQHLCISSNDAAEGVAAFMQKRKPEFKGN